MHSPELENQNSPLTNEGVETESANRSELQ